MNDVNAKDNFRKLSFNIYLVRTQAGFKQACKKYSGDDIVEGFPTSYPSIVQFYDRYRGYHYSHAKCTHVNKYKQHLLNLYEEVKDE